MIKYFKKKTLTASKLIEQDDLDKILEFYDDYYGIYYYDYYFGVNEDDSEYDETDDYEEDEKHYDIEDEDDVNEFYKKMLNKLEIIEFRVKYSRRWNPSVYDVDMCCDTSSFYGHTIHVVDYKSGKSLITNKVKQTSIAKSKGVYVVDIDWHNGDNTRFYNYFGEYIWLYDTGFADVTIIKPKKYKNLCIGVSGNTRLKLSSSDKKYYKGKVDYKKTSWYTGDYSNSKWMRVK